MQRPLADLINVPDPAWPFVQQLIAAAKNPVEVLPASDQSPQVLLQTQVTLRSPMGAIVYHTGGILVDRGWLRILGSGSARLPRSLSDWNLGRSIQQPGEPPGFILIADDVVGGFFALNGGALGPKPGDVFYYAPDTLRWTSLNRGYTDFLNFCFNGDLNQFYETLRWPGWTEEISKLPGDRAMNLYPFPFTAEGKDVTQCARKDVPLAELYRLYVEDIPKQLRARGN